MASQDNGAKRLDDASTRSDVFCACSVFGDPAGRAVHQTDVLISVAARAIGSELHPTV